VERVREDRDDGTKASTTPDDGEGRCVIATIDIVATMEAAVCGIFIVYYDGYPLDTSTS